MALQTLVYLEYINTKQPSLGLAGSLLPRPPSDTPREGEMGQEKAYNRFNASAGQNRIVTHTCLQLAYIHGLSAELPSIVFNPDKQLYHAQQNSSCKSLNDSCNQYPVDRVTQNYIPCLGQRLSKTIPCKAAHPVPSLPWAPSSLASLRFPG